MVTRNFWLAGAVVAATVIVFFIFFHENEIKKVKRTFKNISEHVEKQAGENPLIGAGKVKKLQQAFLDSCVMEVPAASLSRKFSAKDVSNYAYVRRTQFDTLSLSFHDMAIDFNDEATAQVFFTAVLKGRLVSGDPIREAHEMSCILKKRDDTWQISRLEAVEVLEQ